MAKAVVFLCEYCSREGGATIGERYTIAVLTPQQGLRVWHLDVHRGTGDDLGHKGIVEDLLAELEEYGIPVKGARLDLGEDEEGLPASPKPQVIRGEIEPAEPSSTPPEGQEDKRQEETPADVPLPPEGLPLRAVIDGYTQREGLTIKQLSGRMRRADPTIYLARRDGCASADVLRDLFGVMGYKEDALATLVARYTKHSKRGRPPSPVKPGSRAGGLHSKAILGEGSLEGRNPR